MCFSPVISLLSSSCSRHHRLRVASLLSLTEFLYGFACIRLQAYPAAPVPHGLFCPLADDKPECCNETGDVKGEAEPKTEATATEAPEAAPAPAGGESAAPADGALQDGASS